jgi:hypothetical protein
MRYKPVADYGDELAGEPARSGREADDEYAPVEVLADIGAEIVLFGDVEDQLLGDPPPWQRVGVVKYPTRRAFIEMQARPDFQAKHVHKEAGMEATIVLGCRPAPVPLDTDALGPQRAWADVAHPPTSEDGPVVVLHVIKYADGAGRDEMVAYQNEAAKVAGPHGGRVGGWFDVEGTIIGDGRRWDQARFNLFPSKAAFMAVVFDPARMAAHEAHREPAMTDTYTLIVRPTINHLDGAEGEQRR